MSSKFIGMVLTIALIVSQTSAQDLARWDEFKPRTLNDVIEQSSHLNPSSLEDGSMIFTRDKLPSQAKLTYTGKSREISSETKEFIAGWAQMIARHPRIPKLFEKELLFAEGSVEYWLPVPNNGPNYEKELREGEQVSVFISRIGGTKDSGKFIWFFLVNKIERA